MHRRILDAPYSARKVQDALKSIHEDRASGLDGFGSHFYRDAWEIVGDDMVNTALNILREGRLLREVNATIITLIPKSKFPSNVSDFRPISCCHVIYKCITKVLSNRLRNVLPDIIDENQDGFVHDRYIMHN